MCLYCGTYLGTRTKTENTVNLRYRNLNRYIKIEEKKNKMLVLSVFGTNSKPKSITFFWLRITILVVPVIGVHSKPKSTNFFWQQIPFLFLTQITYNECGTYFGTRTQTENTVNLRYKKSEPVHKKIIRNRNKILVLPVFDIYSKSKSTAFLVPNTVFWF